MCAKLLNFFFLRIRLGRTQKCAQKPFSLQDDVCVRFLLGRTQWPVDSASAVETSGGVRIARKRIRPEARLACGSFGRGAAPTGRVSRFVSAATSCDSGVASRRVPFGARHSSPSLGGAVVLLRWRRARKAKSATTRTGHRFVLNEPKRRRLPISARCFGRTWTWRPPSIAAAAVAASLRRCQ